LRQAARKIEAIRTVYKILWEAIVITRRIAEL
jgi:hypothetical protein